MGKIINVELNPEIVLNAEQVSTRVLKNIHGYSYWQIKVKDPVVIRGTLKEIPYLARKDDMVYVFVDPIKEQFNEYYAGLTFFKNVIKHPEQLTEEYEPEELFPYFDINKAISTCLRKGIEPNRENVVKRLANRYASSYSLYLTSDIGLEEIPDNLDLIATLNQIAGVPMYTLFLDFVNEQSATTNPRRLQTLEKILKEFDIPNLHKLKLSDISALANGVLK